MSVRRARPTEAEAIHTLLSDTLSQALELLDCALLDLRRDTNLAGGDELVRFIQAQATEVTDLIEPVLDQLRGASELVGSAIASAASSSIRPALRTLQRDRANAAM